MHYTELLRGVNAYASEGENTQPAFPTIPYPEGEFYFGILIGDQPLVDKVVKFLKKWNRRVKIDYSLLESACSYVPQDVMKWNLLDLPLWEYKEIIVEIFSRFVEAVKYTGAAKALHISNPELFIMWDVKIREGYGCYQNGEGYFNFLLRSQREIQEVIQTYTKEHGRAKEITQRVYGGPPKTLLKLLDEYNWAKYRKEWI